jgi:hypothetical protein
MQDQTNNTLWSIADSNIQTAQTHFLDSADKDSWLMANDPTTPAKVLEKMARIASGSLLERIAGNSAAGTDLLMRLAVHEDESIRAAVAENPSAHLYVFWVLSSDSHADVRYALACNYKVPAKVLEALINDENPYVAYRAQQTYCVQQSQNVVELPNSRQTAMQKDSVC